MGKFRYKAATPDGGIYTGTYIAPHKEDVIKMIRSNKDYPIQIQEEEDNSEIKYRRTWGISYKDYAVLCRQLYAMLNAGVPIIQSLNTMRAQTTKKALREGLDSIYEDVQKGKLVSEAMKKRQDVFPNLLIHMLEAGELSGNLDNTLDRLAYHYEREAKIGSRIKGALIYPMVLTIVAVCVVIFLLTFVMPTFISMFTRSKVNLPLPTQILLGIATFIRAYWVLIILAIAGSVAAFIKFIGTSKGKRWFDYFLMKVPLVKTLISLVLSTRFARMLSTMLGSGIPLIQALENIERIIDNAVVSEGLRTVREEVQRGSDLAGPISRLKFFPPMVANMIHVGEESGTLDEILRKTSDFYDAEVEKDFDRVLALFEPILILVMGVVIGFIVISMALPMFDLVKTVR